YALNKYYTGFKLGSRLVFSVGWAGTYAWKLKLKLPNEAAQGFQGQHWEFQSYDSGFKEVIFRPLTPDHSEIGEVEDLLVAAYQTVSGRR
ncbi:MAG: hypothetical protein QM346_03595, partial [Chloroflexota bacterium]|nr:hypothetical protein [Chloroflexota bacterium]